LLKLIAAAAATVVSLPEVNEYESKIRNMANLHAVSLEALKTKTIILADDTHVQHALSFWVV